MIIDPDFPDHWKTKKLVSCLNGDQAAPVYVLRLWAHCQNRRQWEFEDLSSEALKALCCFPGNANNLESSLAASGFVRRVGKKIVICNWAEYNASLIASWTNGMKGGRRKKEPVGIPTGEPTSSTLLFSNGTGEERSKHQPPFIPPSLEEVKAYCRGRQSPIDPEAFLAYYTSQSWKKKNGQKVTDWRACVITWEKREQKDHPKPKPYKPPPPANAPGEKPISHELLMENIKKIKGVPK